jgi:hypothetical protein
MNWCAALVALAATTSACGASGMQGSNAPYLLCGNLFA